MAVTGTFAYVADWAGIRVLDVTDPALPVPGGRVVLPDDAEQIVISGTVAYVAAGDVGGIRVLDISDPAMPTEVGSYNTPGTAHKVLIDGATAYVADGNQGVRLLDLTHSVWSQPC